MPTLTTSDRTLEVVRELGDALRVQQKQAPMDCRESSRSSGGSAAWKAKGANPAEQRHFDKRKGAPDGQSPGMQQIEE